MINAIRIHAVNVLDQDEALDFYVGKLGFEVTNDVDMGFMRWLTAAQVRDLLTKGALGVAFVATTDDCRATYDELRAKGVEFSQEPVEQPYGIDCAFRDPFGNHIRLTQPVEGPIEITDEDRARWRAGAEVNQ
jgi:predicted enzyme related to lactoylglutathione lyase